VLSLPRLLRRRMGEAIDPGPYYVGLVALVAFSAVSSLALSLLPSSVGGRLLGESWGEVQPHLIWVVPYVVICAVALFARVMVRLLGGELSSSKWQMRFAPVVLVAPTVGAAISGGVGAFVSITAATLLTAAVWQTGATSLLRSSAGWRDPGLLATEG
jgi:hypothetical protein